MFYFELLVRVGRATGNKGIFFLGLIEILSEMKIVFLSSSVEILLSIVITYSCGEHFFYLVICRKKN